MIKACIFDLGGTIVDRYSLTPFLSLRKVFSDKCVNVRDELLFKDMGKSKKEHINEIISEGTTRGFAQYDVVDSEIENEDMKKSMTKIATKNALQIMTSRIQSRISE